MNRNIRKITDGAMMAAIMGAMLLLNRQTAGLFEGSMLFLFPLPCMFYAAKYGLKDSWLLYISVILLSFIIGTPQTLLLIAAEALIGTVYGAGVHNGTQTRKLVLRTVLLAVITDVLTMLVFASFFGYDLTAELTEYKSIVSQAMAQSGAVLPDTLNIDSFLRNILIVSTIMTGIMEGLVTHFLSRLLLKRLRLPAPKETPLALYFPPKWTGYAGIAGMMGYFYSVFKPLENEAAQSFLQGAGMIGVFYLAFYGVIAVMILIALRNPKAKILAFFLSLFLLITSSPLMALFGFLYITTDLHMRMIRGGANASEN